MNGELRGVVRGRDFRRLYVTRLGSQFTDGVFQVGLAGFVFFSPERQTSAGKAAVAFAVVLLPYSVIGPFVGVLIDRWRRREILLRAPMIRAGLLCVAAALLVAGHDGVFFFLAALLILGVNRFFLSALSAALPHVVRREQLVTANSLSVTSGTIIAFVGAGAGYVLRLAFGGGRYGTASILLCAAGCYVLAGLSATRLGRDQLGPDPDDDMPPESFRGVLRGLSAGARYLWLHRPAALALAAISYHRFLYGITLIMTLLLYRNHFTDNADDGLKKFATVLGISGLGYFLAAVITPPIVRRISKNAWIVILLGGAGGSLAVFGLPYTDVPWTIGAFLLGVVSQGIKLSADTILQETVTDNYRGRVFALYDMLFNATFAAAAAAAALSIPTSGLSYPALNTVIAAYALGAVLYTLASRSTAREPAKTP